MHRANFLLNTRAYLVVHNVEAVIDDAVKVLGKGMVAHARRPKGVAGHLQVQAQESGDHCEPRDLVQCKDVFLMDGVAYL